MISIEKSIRLDLRRMSFSIESNNGLFSIPWILRRKMTINWSRQIDTNSSRGVDKNSDVVMNKCYNLNRRSIAHPNSVRLNTHKNVQHRHQHIEIRPRSHFSCLIRVFFHNVLAICIGDWWFVNWFYLFSHGQKSSIDR